MAIDFKEANAMTWQKYYELEPYHRCKNDGRDLIGMELVITEKRDGENVSLWINESGNVQMSSHNQINADANIQERMRGTKEFEKACKLLIEERDVWHNDLILYGELMKRVGATKIERQKKHCHWIIFDIYSLTEKKYLDYNYVYQRAFQFKIPIVKALGVELSKEYEDLEKIKIKWLKWCRRHRREGIVAKAYHMKPQTFFKEKIDIPNLKRMHNTERIRLPAMPLETAIRALQHAWDEINDDEKWKDRRIAMPIIAKHFQLEAREHNYEMPNPYSYYINTPIEKVKPNESGRI